MNKSVKLLMESLFEEPLFEGSLFDELGDDIFGDEDEEIASSLHSILKLKLTLCKTIDEINLYFFEKTNLMEDIHEVLQYIVDIFNNYGYVRESQLKSFPNSNIKLKLRSYRSNAVDVYSSNTTKQLLTICIDPCTNEIVQRISKKALCVTVKSLVEKQSITWNVLTYGLSDRQKQAIEKFNNTQIYSNRNTELRQLLCIVFKDVFKTERLLEELTCTGKVYKVTEKDIDRMYTCIGTKKYTGFDLITKPDKMVARLAALLICAKNLRNKDMQIQFNDNIIIDIITGQCPWRTNRAYINKETYIEVLRRIQKFPSIHIKDIIATYNAYKDKF